MLELSVRFERKKGENPFLCQRIAVIKKYENNVKTFLILIKKTKILPELVSMMASKLQTDYGNF